jgi:hypothetical protein
MTITTTKLTRAAGLCAVVAGLLFIAIQVKHPTLDVAFTTTTEWKVRQGVKVLMATLSLAGITGMYLRQVTKTGLLGLVGYVLFALGYLMMLATEVAGLVVLPSIAHGAPGYVTGVLAAASGGHPTADIGLMQQFASLNGLAYIAGGLIFGIALFRANILARWAAALLAVAAVSTVGVSLLPQVNYRLFAIPIGVAMVGLGYSLWREQRTPAAQPVASPASLAGSQLNPVGAK